MEFMTMLASLPVGWAIFYIAAFLVALTLIVFIHEYGHFKVARLCGISVDTFSIGFGKEIWGFNDRFGTRWKVGWLPLGGYVKFTGDANAASAPGRDRVPEPGSFHAKPVWKRAAVVAAGPFANFLSAIVIFAAAYFFVGETVIGPKVGAVTPDGAAAEAGIRPGDVITSINGRLISEFNDIVLMVTTRAGERLTIVVDRDGRALSFDLVARTIIEDRGFFGKISIGRIGVEPSRAAANTVPVDLRRAVSLGVKRTWFIVETTFRYLGKLFAGHESIEQLGGVGSMAKATGDAAAEGLFPFIAMVGFLSVSIGLINLFPIPMLDGGHLVFYAIEAVRRRPLGPVAEEWGYKIGFAVVLMLMFIGNFNDLVKAIRQSLP